MRRQIAFSKLVTSKFFLITTTCTALLSLLAAANSANAREISIMQYNAENLFDTIKDPVRGNDDWTPDGPHQWTPQKLSLKLQQLGKVLKAVRNADGSVCPDLVSLVEVENANVLKQFKNEALKECKYDKIIIDPKDPDQRGIKVAIMTRLNLAGKPISHPTYPSGRFIQETPVEVNGHILFVFVNHWKSRIPAGPGEPDPEEKRKGQAKLLRSLMAAHFSQNPDTDMVALGDFNDEFENTSINQVLGAAANPQEVSDSLDSMKLWESSFDLLNSDAFKGMDPDERHKAFLYARSTYYYARDKAYNGLDHILLSRGLLDTEGFAYKPLSFGVVRLALNTDPKTKGPLRFTPIEDQNGEFTKAVGASDHFPVMMRLYVQD